MRKTKIVCTIGPASESEEVMIGLCRAGMNVARMNFSHSTHEEHKRRIDLVKKVRKELGLPIAIMLDTKGPEYRIKTFENGNISLCEGETFTFTTEDVIGDTSRVSVSYAGLASELSVGDTILLNNGLLSFCVEEIKDTDIVCKVVCGGVLSDRKSMSFPGKVMKQKYLSEQDKDDIAFGVKNGVDYIACSFVSCRQDMIDVQEYLKEIDARDIELIAKIENQSGFDNIEEICAHCDGIMIARGDMGVEVPFEMLPAMQKKLITKCRLLGKRVITATEMLESMIYNPRPTRAEISDVANAVYDGTSAIMLSGETAAGKFPILAVETMAKIAETTENNIDYKTRFYASEFKIKNSVDAISHSSCVMAMDLEAKAVVACSLSGMTARLVSRFRPSVPIIGLTTNENTWRRLALSWGVIPALCEQFASTDVLFYMAKNISRETLSLSRGDKIVITGGDTSGQSGKTSLIKVEEI
ncbi:MAG: pyruvate kinase [Ruminococcaceae bacterium]|nr:pyruvate kinase [Oscillospiraceae bacterium]